MQIFISWSGYKSKSIAEILNDWLRCVIQASKPWISSRDIDKGAIWFSELNNKLNDVSIGIVCLTQENKDTPWILFETGALAKGLTTNKVCTFLIDLNPEDLQDPLAQFNHTRPTKESLWELVRTINNSLDANSLDERILEQVFETYWPQFEVDFNSVIENSPKDKVIKPRSDHELLSEILNISRSLNHRVRDLESNNKYASSKDKDNSLSKNSKYLATKIIGDKLIDSLYNKDEAMNELIMNGHSEISAKNFIEENWIRKK